MTRNTARAQCLYTADPCNTVAWRFNRRFVLKTIYERLAIAAAATPPMPYRLSLIHI